jgi:Rrf2 family protein
VRLELTKRADYAIRAVVALARAQPGSRLSVRTIAETQRVPARFLTQVMGDLVAAGIAEAKAGRTGGYRLAAGAAEKSILDVIEAIEGDSRRRTCILRGGPCRLDGVCDVHAVFAAAQDEMLRGLRGASIASLAATADAVT